MRLAGHKPARREGAREGRWTLLDYVDIVVHIQHQDERNFYALDRLWRDCPVVPVDLDGPSREGPPPGHAAARADRVQRGQPDAGPTGHRPVRPRPGPGCRRGRGAGQASAVADRVLGPAAGAGHRGQPWRARRNAGAGRHPAAGDASRRLAGPDAPRGRCRGAGRPAGVARQRPLGAARRREPGRRRRAQHAAGGRASRRADRSGVSTNPTGRWCWSRTAA